MVRKTRHAISSSLTRTMPSPIEPNSGFTIDVAERRGRRRRPPPAFSQTTVSGRGKAALLQQRRGPELVHRALDGPRRVHHPDAAVLQAVQRVHPEDDLLQRAGRG